MADEQETNLLKKAAAGDPDAFSSLMSQYAGRIYGLCFSLLNNRQDAEDCTQDAFIKAFRSIRQYQFKSSFYTWLYRIAVNTCLDLLRHQQHPPVLSLDEAREGEDHDLPLQVADPGPLPDETAISHELGDIIRQEIACLPDYLQETLVLRDIEGFAYHEIAQMLHISEGTVKSRLFRARSQLMQAIRSREQTVPAARQKDSQTDAARRDRSSTATRPVKSRRAGVERRPLP